MAALSLGLSTVVHFCHLSLFAGDVSRAIISRPRLLIITITCSSNSLEVSQSNLLTDITRKYVLKYLNIIMKKISSVEDLNSRGGKKLQYICDRHSKSPTEEIMSAHKFSTGHNFNFAVKFPKNKSFQSQILHF